MHYLEVRRHTMRTKPGVHLSQAGVDLARKVGNGLGPFQQVVTSDLPRAYETAIAMGFAVDAQYPLLSQLGDAVDAEVDWTTGFYGFAKAVRGNGATAQLARDLAELWHNLATVGHSLIISHGGLIEAGTIGCMPDSAAADWQTACDYCEGVRLTYEDGRFTNVELLQL